MTLGRDAQTSGDHVGAENYYQHAEHYYRIMLANNLVKLDKQEDNTQDDKASSEAEGEAVKLNKDGTVMEDGEKEAAEATEESAETTEEAPQEPMIVDLSEAEASEAEDGEADTSDEAEVIEINIADGSAEEGDEEKPKSKRRVSRTRGLRRRTSRRRSSETESEEG